MLHRKSDTVWHVLKVTAAQTKYIKKMKEYIDFAKVTPMNDLIAAHGAAQRITTNKAGDIVFHELVFEDNTSIPFSKTLNEFLAGGGKLSSLQELGQCAEFGSLVKVGSPKESHTLKEFIQNL